MQRLFGFAAIVLIAAGLFVPAARADDRDICREKSGDEAITACTRGINSGKFKGSDLANLYINRGYERKAKGDVDGAIADYNQGIRLNPSDAIAYNNRGNARRDKGDIDGAIADYDQANQLDPKYTAVLTNRGLAYKKKNDLVRARADFNAALALPQKYDSGKWAHDTAREQLAALGDPAPDARSGQTSNRTDDRETCRVASGDEAIAACTRAIDSGKYKGNDLATIYFNRGLEWQNKGERDSAIADYTQTIKLDPKNAPAYNNRGNARKDKGDLDGAIADYNQAIQIDPKYTFAYNNRGTARHDKKDHDGAIADYNQAIQLDPKYAHAYNNRGIARKDKGDFSGAIADFGQAIQLDPKYAEAYDNRGDARKGSGDLDGAIADYEQAIRLDPTFTAAYTDLALIYEAKGDIGRARAQFNLALSIPQKYGSGKWAHNTARDHLAKLPAENTPSTPTVVDTRVAKANSSTPTTSVGRRVALVIGNSAYKSVAALPNPSRDAAAVADVLRRAGFQTATLETDLTLDRFINALRLFARQAESAEWALIYYAGHGIEMGGVNYLVPVDARLETDRDVSYEAVPLEQVLNAVEGARKLRVVILDACRDNPFANKMKRTTASRSVGRGLARVEPEGGTLVAYAAKGGEVAMDGDGQNSPFVTAILKYLPMPGVEINKFFRLVRDDVLNATNRRQEPFVYGSLPSDDFFFVAK